METPQLSFSRIVRESGTTLVVTMGLYLVPSCTVALLPTANYRQRTETGCVYLSRGASMTFIMTPKGVPVVSSAEKFHFNVLDVSSRALGPSTAVESA